MDEITARSLARVLETVQPEARAGISQIFPQIYDELRHVARRYLDQRQGDHTLQPTALVNEAFLRVRSTGSSVESDRHALALAAVAMRCILVDHARRRSAGKRGGDHRRVALNDVDGADSRKMEVLELDDLLHRYAELDPRRAHVVELRFFAGLTNDEIAQTLGVARSTVAEDWAVARAWLRVQLNNGHKHGTGE